MSRSSRQKDKHEKGSELFEDHRNGGTAARTRPFSFDEIMLRRKNKKESGIVEVPPEGAAITSKGTSVKLSGREESNRHRHDDFGTSSGKHVLDESLKVASRRKEDDTSIKDKKQMKDEEKGSRDIERKAEAAENTIKSGDKAKGVKKYRLPHDKRKDELSSDDSGYDHGKRDSKVSIFKDRHADGSRGTSEMVNKRKKENEDDMRTRDRNAAKKHDSQKRHDSQKGHDSQKRHDSEFSERKEKKEATQSRHDDSRSKRRRSRSREHGKEKSRRSLSPEPEKKERKEAPKSRHEDSKSKRRRSRSREHEKDKNRRSRSLSPKGHKRTSYDTRELGELTSHSSKDRSGRSNSDIDRKRIHINGSSNQSRRHGASTSRLGGYSPRKRRSEAAIKTPSPTSRSPEKKNAGWDFSSVKTESNYPGSILSNLESSNQTVSLNESELSSVVTVPSSNPRPNLGVVSTIPSSTIKSSIDSIQLTQATRPKRRLYVENLPPSASEEAVMEWINSYLLSSGFNHIQGTNPCISCIINKEKGQALVEFLTPEDASATLSFDGRTFSGTILKIRRPKDFAEVTTGIPEKSVAAVDSIRDIVEDSPHKIFVGGIAKVISSEMLMEIVSAFGHLKAYHFETNVDLIGSCAFLEYVDQSVTSKACAGLNGMRLGGQVLTVTQAVPDASSLENLGNKPFYGIPDHAKRLLEKPTQVLKLNNVLDPNSLSSLSEPELEEILEDIRLECARFGTVKSINIVKLTKCTASSDACGDTKNTTSVVDDEGCDDKKKTETEVMVLDTGNIGRSEMSLVSLSNEELEEVEEPSKESTGGDDISDGSYLTTIKKDPDELNNNVEANNTCDDVRMVDRVKDEVCDPAPLVSSVVDQETLPNASTSELTTPVDDRLTSQEKRPADNILEMGDHETETKVSVEVELKPEDTNSNLEKELDLPSANTEELDSTERGFQKENESDLKDVFEPGCVLVEYRRAEASSIAAHCLHGRLFDNRVVTVEYVAHDLYCTRFPK